MRLRYAGTCHGCGTQLPAGQWAVYHRLAKQVECLDCAISTGVTDGAADPNVPTAAEARPASAEIEVDVDAGNAGASARREYERRVAKRDQRVRAAHPHIGALILALTDHPQATRAWARGATGEERLAKRLDSLAQQGVRLLHDRRIPRTRANIDHIAVSAAGVFILDAKRYQGRPSLQVRGGLFTPRTESLLVGRRDCTKLVHGVQRQVELVRAAMADHAEFADVPVAGMLCFIDADWPLIGGSFRIAGLDVLWPAKAAEKITAAGPVDVDRIEALHRLLAKAFPPA